MQEYRIDVKVKNNIILYKIEKAGYKTLGEFCRLNGIMKYVSQIGSIVNMKESPLQSDGNFRKCITHIADLLGCDPLDFFTDTQLHIILKSNKRSIQVNEAEMRFMLEKKDHTKLLDNIIHDEQRTLAIDKALETLTPREKRIIEMRMGLGNFDNSLTLEECGNLEGTKRERIRQIEAKALRKLRSTNISEPLRDFLED